MAFTDTQQALRWWCQRQTLGDCYEAEAIRDGLLQESFALWRQLETAVPSTNATANSGLQLVSQAQLATIERLHGALQAMGDRLSPPYADDCLILALQHLLERRRVETPLLKLQTQFPSQWRSEPYQISRTVLTTVDELLHLVIGQTLTDLQPDMSVQLRSRHDRGELVVQFTYPAGELPPHPSRTPEFAYLRRAFQVLTRGRCFYQITTASVTWHLLW